MSCFDQCDYAVRCEWGLAGITHLAPADVVVIVDVLSFTTSVDVAVGRGASVLPYRWKDAGAAEYARTRGAELAGRRGEAAHQYSLAPSSVKDIAPGTRLVLPSPNGSTLAFASISSGTQVAAACLRNARAVAGWVASVAGSIAVIPAGERWPDGTLRPAVEDLLGAGAVIRHLPGERSPEAELAVAAFERTAAELEAYLLHSASGRELVEKGFAEDVCIAADLDASDVVPVMRNEAFKNVGRPVAEDRSDRGGEIR